MRQSFCSGVFGSGLSTRVVQLGGILLILFLEAGCPDDCMTNETQQCFCPNDQGAQTCGSDGKFGACICKGGTEGGDDAGVPGLISGSTVKSCSCDSTPYVPFQILRSDRCQS